MEEEGCWNASEATSHQRHSLPLSHHGPQKYPLRYTTPALIRSPLVMGVGWRTGSKWNGKVRFYPPEKRRRK